MHRRLILASTPRERERWHAIWLLAQGWTASGAAQALGRDPHTIVRWAAAFGRGGPSAWIFEQSGGAPRPRPGGVAGSGPRIACGSGRRSGQLELEGGPPVRLGAVRHLPEPQQLSELPPFSRGQALPGCSPDFNADEAIWGWVREEATGNLCLGTGSWCGRR